MIVDKHLMFVVRTNDSEHPFALGVRWFSESPPVIQPVSIETLLGIVNQVLKDNTILIPCALDKTFTLTP